MGVILIWGVIYALPHVWNTLGCWRVQSIRIRVVFWAQVQ